MEPINRVSNGEVRRIYCARVQHSGVFFFHGVNTQPAPSPSDGRPELRWKSMA